MKRSVRMWPVAGIVLCLAVLHSAGQARPQELDPADWSDVRKEEFLLNADIGVMREISTGRSGTRRAEMSDDGMTRHDAHVQTVDEYRATIQLTTGVELNFMDSYKFNIAAYRLDRLLDLQMVPVSVERRVARERAAVTWWVDDVQMMLLDFVEDGLQAPDLAAWNDQMYHVRLFNELVYNTDANLGNLLITDDWALVMIDFTRAFRINDTLRAPENLEGVRVARHVYDNLRKLDLETLTDVMDDFLSGTQIRALLARRDLIVRYLEERIELRGEAAVIRG